MFEGFERGFLIDCPSKRFVLFFKGGEGFGDFHEVSNKFSVTAG